MIRGLSVLLVVVAAAFPVCAEPLVVQLATHNESPNPADTPNFSSLGSQAQYTTWRNALKEFAEMCVARGIRYNCQCDWNFLEGVRKWEVNPVTAIPGITTNTDNKNILLYLHDLGQATGVTIEIDPHSHESSGYTYADVAWLIGQCGVDAAPVVGGHDWDGATTSALDFARFNAATGVAPGVYAGTASNWFPQVLSLPGSAGHVNDPHDSGVWRPTSGSSFYTHSPSGSLVAVGHWQNDLFATADLMERIERGELAPTGRLWTASLVLNHRDFQDEAYRTNEARRILDTLKRWQDEGRIRTATFLETVGIWQTNFAEAAHIHVRPPDNLSFSLNWQDFHYTNESAGYLDRILDLHEEHGVPVDLFFTTWQTDIIEGFPNLMGRILSSGAIAQGYHVRPPKPYASSFLWGSITNPATDKSALILQYETHGLNMGNGQPTTNWGGFDKISTLQGYAPVCVGALSPASVASNVYTVFSNLGARMFVRHSPPVNANSLESYTDLPYRPEHWDWKLIAMWTTNASDPQPSSITQAIGWAHNSATNGGTAPWFVGIKLHDNDLFAEQSQWTLVYSNAFRQLWQTNLYSAELPDAVQSNRFAFYESLVVEAASRRTNINLLNSFDTVALMGDARARPIGLSRTKVDEHPDPGTEVALIRGGGAIAGEAVYYQLVAGDGDDDNGRFTVSSNRLLAAAGLDYESNPVCHLRMRWEWRDSLAPTNVLDSGERALTLVLRNSESDDDDGDGFTEAEEAVCGTDPLDPDSVFEIVTSPVVTGPTSTVAASSVAARFYTLESSTNLMDWIVEPFSTNVAGTGSALPMIDPNSAAPVKFYRVAVFR